MRDRHLKQILVYRLDLICVQPFALNKQSRHEKRVVSTDLVTGILELEHLVLWYTTMVLIINLTDIAKLLGKVY